MRKLLFLTVMAICCLQASAQDDVYGNASGKEIKTTGDVTGPLNEEGNYEEKRVLEVEGATAGVLFGRAMEALSDMVGADGNVKAGIDYSDKDAGTIVYKGNSLIGYASVIGDKIPFYMDFTLKIRCKDGRAQVTITVAGAHAIAKSLGVQHYKMEDLEKVVLRRPKRFKIFPIPDAANALFVTIEEKLKKTADDDF